MSESVSIELKDFISLVSGEIARRVTDELKTVHIDPLIEDVAQLKARLMPHKLDANTLTIARWKGAWDAVWKVGIVIVAGVQVYHYLFQR